MKKLVFFLLVFVSAIGGLHAQVKNTNGKPAAGANTQNPAMKNLLDSFSYAAGVNIANSMRDQGITSINSSLLVKAIDDVFSSKAPVLNQDQCNNSLQEQMGIFGKVKEEENKKKLVAEKAKGDAFLATNKTRKGVITLSDGMQYEVLKAGDNGSKPTLQDTVVVDYVGTLITGEQFDASTGKGPAIFELTRVIRGWTEILQLMTKGAHWKVYIPSDLAYGDRGNGGSIPGGATLVFEITLLDIKPATVK